MSKTSKELLKNLWREKESNRAQRREADAGITFLPGQFYFGADDKELKSITRQFPAVIFTTHPVYVLKKIANLGYKLCPCTTNDHNHTPYIMEGCVLEDTGRRIKRTSFVLTQYAFNITKAKNFCTKLDYAGLVPKKCFKEPK